MKSKVPQFTIVKNDLEKKISSSIHLLQSIPSDEIELCYSGGKDSDVILQLAKEACISFRPIYKMTTIDPPGTLRHVINNNVEILRPKRSFFDIVSAKGAPNRFHRFCCSELKEYKVLDFAIVGVRRDESRKRAELYKEPVLCRFYSKSSKVQQFLPILEWSLDDVASFISDRGLTLAPVYLDSFGNYDFNKRLGCMCCPLASFKKRIAEFKAHPNMVKAYINAMRKFISSHPNSKKSATGCNEFTWFYRDVLCRNDVEFQLAQSSLFGFNPKEFISDFFKVDLL